MSLIEQLGGYEKAKAFLNATSFTIDELIMMQRSGLRTQHVEKALLEYRRQHNIFEVGDYVFHTVCKNPLLEVVTWTDGKRIRTDLAGRSAPTETFVHATDAEIKAGKRLEVNQ